MKKCKIIKVLIIALSLFALWIFIAPFLAKNLVAEKSLENADIIIVLSGSTAFVERTKTAAELYSRGVSQKILLTDDGENAGWSSAEHTNPKYSELAKRELLKHGVAAEHIEILQPQVGGTIYEAKVFFEHYAKDHKVQHVLLVTSAYHSNRTFWTFERENRRNNLKINFGIEHAPFNERNPPPDYWWLKFAGWRVVAGEYVKILVYWIFY